MEDLYKILGIEKDASPDQIKKAYRTQAMKYHPDRNPGDKEAEEKFKRINEAYSILSDEQKRKQYDLYGSEEEQRRNAYANANAYTSQQYSYYYQENPFEQWFRENQNTDWREQYNRATQHRKPTRKAGISAIFSGVGLLAVGLIFLYPSLYILFPISTFLCGAAIVNGITGISTGFAILKRVRKEKLQSNK